MAPSILLATEPGPAADALGALLTGEGVAVTVADPEGRLPDLSGLDAVVHLPGEDPFDSDSRVAGDLETLAAHAAGAGARMILCSSVLLYADCGGEEIAANDPELAPPEELRGLAAAELDLFGSSAEVMLLRLGVILAPGNAACRELSDGLSMGTLRAPADRESFVPLLDRRTLAGALARVSAGGLHGAWDLVTDVAPLAELLDHAAAVTGTPESSPATREEALGAAGERPGIRWLRSRRVTGAALREAGAADGGDWRELVDRELR